MAFCGKKCFNLKVNTINIFGIHFSYNDKSNMDKNVLIAVSNIQNVLKKWGVRNLTLEGRIRAFRTLALS